MRNSIFISFILIFLSCSKESITKDSFDIEIENEGKTMNTILELDNLPFNKIYSIDNNTTNEVKEKILNEFKLSFKDTLITNNPNPVIHGPFTAIAYKPNAFPKDTKILYNDGYPPATGTYFSDIYNYRIAIQLPENAVMGYVESVDEESYSDYSTQIPGFIFTNTFENGRLHLIGNTYMMLIKYNMLGQYIGIEKPTTLDNQKIFTYYYITQ